MFSFTILKKLLKSKLGRGFLGTPAARASQRAAAKARRAEGAARVGGGGARASREQREAQQIALATRSNIARKLFGGATAISEARLREAVSKLTQEQVNRLSFTEAEFNRINVIRQQEAISVAKFERERQVSEETKRKEAERKQAAEIQKSLFEKQLARATTEAQRQQILRQAGIAGFKVIPPPLSEGALEVRRREVTAKGKIIKEERKLISPLLGGEDITGPKPEKKDVTPTKFKLFEESIEAQKKRQKEFFESPGFQRIEDVAGRLTFGGRKAIEERGLIGGVSQSILAGFMGFPIALGGALSLTGEKIKLTGEALGLGKVEVPGGFVQFKKKKILEELIGAGPRTIEEFKGLPLREKLALGGFVAISPFLGGGPIRQFLAKRAGRAKAIKELTFAERAKLERFELSVQELKGVRTKPKRINLLEVERLSQKSAKALERVLLRKKKEIVVGGSVAQRTQIKGKSRIPEDIDIFTSGDKRALLREIAKELQKEGVERVSVVRDKQITIKGKKAIEIKDLDLLKQNIQKVQLPFQLFSSALATTERGIKVLRLGSQAQRKVVGGFGLERERIRTKDITDLPPILRTLRGAKRASLSITSQIELRPFTPIKPISFKIESLSQLIGGIGEPPRGGISLIKPTVSELSIITPSRPSIISPSELESISLSEIKPSPTEIPSIFKPVPKKEIPSKITSRSITSELKKITSKDMELIKPIKKRRGLILDFDSITKEKHMRGFNVLVREGERRADRFKRVAGNLPINRALRRGKRIVDGFIEASFKVEPSGKKTKLIDQPLAPDLSKFRRPKGKTKLPAGTYVEKRKHRLDSIGEIRDISFFKQKAKQKKQRKQGLGIFPI